MTEEDARLVEEEFKKVSSLLSWSETFLTIGGIWPLDKTYKRATFFTIYLTFQLIMEYGELLAVFGDLEAMVLSVLESVMQSMVYTKLFVFRYSVMLRNLILTIKEDFEDTYYEDWVEKKIYLEYNALAKLFYKISMPYITVAATLYYLRPFLTYYVIMPLITDTSNLTFLVLPFRLKLFFPIETTQSYFIMYGYLSPMVYLLICHNAWICLLITMVLHICGQLAVLNYRIRRIPPDIDEHKIQVVFGRLVRRHMRSIWMAKKLDDTFHFVLLIDLVGTTLLLGLMCYIVIIGSSMSESSFGYVYIICAIATVFLLYGYCIVGECLINESKKINEAYYECLWYKSSQKFRKSLLICLTETQEPLRITAGKFFTFSLSGFTDVLKTAMSYLSMLRKMTQEGY
ncbi:odorant receptor 13a-like [Cotesia glomerata]|uniref:odorant receptor 13a-like n=1 Tax=Cotesia glomerata TaxID=32391 RepID=UPI001D011AF2|nr:odorant receptor 13a-like [Cotesia glomerata]